ncbi:PrsW family glutamic-type intramembrane protease [Streptomyces collinus]|uniref:PrsW family glutamic-type intramembrane protease n=1 Tax=Streptomyces collinus TaxID=42684 RepID=UPI002942328B|nr:PrsW family glutamic-type intramembrane protease [Streptomyces collinus]
MTHSPPPGMPRARIPGPQQPPPPFPRIAAGLWKRCLAGGLATWTLIAVAAYATRSAAALPALVLLGGFLVPVVFVLWAYERHSRDLGVSAILGCFLAGGALGVPGAAATEPYLPRLGAFTGVALVEEAAKLGALAFALRRQPGIRGTRAGLVLGAAVGLGFAALEGCGHALGAAVAAGGADPRGLLETESLRGVVAPFGQGLWTAIAGGVLLSLRRPNGHFRLAAPVVGACLGVSMLHALWDATHGAAIWLVALLSGTGLDAEPFAQGYRPRPGAVEQHLFVVFSVGGLVLVGLLGAAWARSLAHRDPSWRNTP